MRPERRHIPRSHARLIAVFKNLTTGRMLRALTWNLSPQGMQLTTEGVVVPGTRLEVDLKLPDRQTPIVLTATVIWSQQKNESYKSYETPEFEIGVKFLDLTPHDRTALKHYVSS